MAQAATAHSDDDSCDDASDDFESPPSSDPGSTPRRPPDQSMRNLHPLTLTSMLASQHPTPVEDLPVLETRIATHAYTGLV